MEEEKFDFSKVSTNKKISKEDIFERFDQLILFERYFGSTINIKKNYRNRLRSDQSPNCNFRFKNGVLKFYDYAASKSYDVIEWVKHDFNLTYPEALKKIYNDFNLEGYKHNPIIHLPYEIEENHSELIQIIPKEYSQQFIDYYDQYSILPETCKNDNVYCVDKLFIDGKQWYINSNELCIAYYFPEIDKIKILRPNQPKNYKWRTNAPNTFIDGLNDITNEVDYIIFMKSKKDKMLIKQLGFKNIVSTQMEGTFVITEETKDKIKSLRKIIWMDNDNTGKKVSKHYESEGFVPILFNDIYLDHFNVKDPSDYVKVFKNSNEIIKLINNIIMN